MKTKINKKDTGVCIFLITIKILKYMVYMQTCLTLKVFDI